MFSRMRHSMFATGRNVFATIAACMLLAATAGASNAPAKGDIVVVTVHGEVTATMAGVTSPLSGGAILQLPATIRTGHDGAIELRQGPTTIAAAGSTELEIPQSAAEEGLIERIVQISGNAFYNVGKRERTKLRVETPYLVAVIKGTQFNVAAAQDGTTIALFEGRLEIRAADESDVVDLRAGEIAIRNRNDVSIRVLRMNAASTADIRRDHSAVSDHADVDANADGSSVNHPQLTAGTGSTNVVTDHVGVDTTAATPNDSSLVAQTAISNGTDVNAKIGLGGGSAGEISPQVDVGLGASTGPVTASAAVDVGSGGVAAGIGAGVSLGAVSADVGTSASIDPGAGSVAASTSAAVNLGGAASVGAGVSTAVDLGAGTVAVGAGSSVVAGPASVDLGAAASVASSSVSVATDVGASLAGVTAGADVSAAITPATGVSVDASLAVTPVVDVSAGVSVGSGTVAAGVGVGGLVDVGVSLGAGTVSVGSSTPSGVGGLLGGLLGGLRRPK
jgi:hypothetical protein